MNNEEQLRESFNEFVIKKNVEYHNDMSARQAREIADFFLTHHRQAFKRVEGKIEKLPSYYGNPKHNEMIYRADALAIIREEI